jgi:hypothetical protein
MDQQQVVQVEVRVEKILLEQQAQQIKVMQVAESLDQLKVGQVAVERQVLAQVQHQ